MCNNTSYFPTQNYSTLSFSFGATTFVVSIIVAILSPVAVVGNALILALIWRNLSLRTPSYILLAVLAFTDFNTGLVSMPFFVVKNLIPMAYIWHRIVKGMPVGWSCYLLFMTASIVTLMSVERWLHMTRRSLVTTRRVCYIVSVLLVLPSPFVVCYVEGTYIHDDSVTVASISLVLFSLSVTSLVFFKVFRIIRRHQQQISQANESSHNFGQPSINLAKYKKSMLSIIYILAVFLHGLCTRCHHCWSIFVFA